MKILQVGKLVEHANGNIDLEYWILDGDLPLEEEVQKFRHELIDAAKKAGTYTYCAGETLLTTIPVFKITLEEAIHKAERFLEDLAGARFYRLINTEQRGTIWKLRYDVGILKKKMVEVVVDDKTGKIESYEVVPAPGKTPS